MKINRYSIEPFAKYPESLIDSKEKAVKVIRDNSYYFYIIGILSLLAGSFFLFRNKQSFDIPFGMEVLTTGILYISLAYLAFSTKSRIAALFLGMIVLIPFIIGIYHDYNNFFSIFKLLLCFSAYRILKATIYYNKKEKSSNSQKYVNDKKYYWKISNRNE